MTNNGFDAGARETIKRFCRDQSGATAVEYGLIAAIVFVGIIISLQGVRTELHGTFTMIAGKFAPFIS